MARVGWVFTALVLSLVLYYVLDEAGALLGMLTTSGAFYPTYATYRILLLPVAAIIVFRIFWSRITGTAKRSLATLNRLLAR